MLPRDLGFRVRLVAPLDMRVKRFATRHNMSVEEAREKAPEIDRERAEFVENHFHARVEDPTRYDMTLNTEHFSPAQAADAIMLVRDVMKGRSQSGGESKPAPIVPKPERIRDSRSPGSGRSPR
jgi:cytidylate kinase